MHQTVVYTFLLCQFIIQFALYFTICRPILKATVPHVYELLERNNIDLRWIYKIFNITMILVNLLISFLVLKFTKSGAIAGVTNMTASVILGLLLVLDVRILTRRRKYAKINH